MKLSQTDLQELNMLLRDRKLNLPDFRRTVTASGANYKWLQKRLPERNPVLNARITWLLEI